MCCGTMRVCKALTGEVHVRIKGSVDNFLVLVLPLHSISNRNGLCLQLFLRMGFSGQAFTRLSYSYPLFYLCICIDSYVFLLSDIFLSHHKRNVSFQQMETFTEYHRQLKHRLV